jgi:hypothetical protein
MSEGDFSDGEINEQLSEPPKLEGAVAVEPAVVSKVVDEKLKTEKPSVMHLVKGIEANKRAENLGSAVKKLIAKNERVIGKQSSGVTFSKGTK